MKVVYSERCQDFGSPGHPERPERVRSIAQLIHDDYEFLSPEPATDELILAAHSARLLTAVSTGAFSDPDTPAYESIFDLALLSAGAAVKSAELALDGATAFSLMRPPGHHAGRDFLGGFCYFNNIAIAALEALKRVARVAIIDFDCHHGNGTQDVFRGNDRVLYVSLHESPLFPGTGLATVDNCLNYPLPPGTDETAYLPVFDEALERVSEFEPALIAISAGFDSHRADPLTTMRLETASFGKIGSRIVALDKPTFSVLEGGYSGELADSVRTYLREFH